MWKVIWKPLSLKIQCNSASLCAMIRRLRSDRNTDSWLSVVPCLVFHAKLWHLLLTPDIAVPIYCYICWVELHVHLYLGLLPLNDLAPLSYKPKFHFPRIPWIHPGAQGALVHQVPDRRVFQFLFPLLCARVAMLSCHLRFCTRLVHKPHPHRCTRFWYVCTHCHPHKLSLSQHPLCNPMVVFHLPSLNLSPVSDEAHVLQFLDLPLQSTACSASTF